MYANPINIRKHRVTIRLNDIEADLLDAINNYNGSQKATLLREILLSGVHRVLQGELDIGSREAQMEGAQMALFGAR